MPEETLEQLIEKYPYLKDYSTSNVIVDKVTYQLYKNDEKIKIGHNIVSISLLKTIITSDYYYEVAKKLFRNEIEEFKVSYLINGDIGGTISLYKGEIIKGLDAIISQGLAVFDDLAYRRYDELKKEITYDKFLEKYEGNNYNITIEGRKYAIPITEMMSVLTMPTAEFETICESSEIKEINGIPKEHYIYAFMKFFKENNLPRKYQFPLAVKEKIVAVGTNQVIDIEAVDKITVISDYNINQIEVSPELKNRILEGLPIDATEVEKAIYIYIKMCKLLTYDDEFYAVNQKGAVAQYHEDVNHVKEITPTNNKVVCYEFNAIYGKLLEAIGLKFSTDQALIDGFGGGHANLKFRSGKYLVNADSVTSILDGDMLNAKLNRPLVGLKCINKNNQSKEEFISLVTKMYSVIVSQEMQQKVEQLQPEQPVERSIEPQVVEQKNEVPKQIEHTETFEEILDQYKRSTKQIIHISLSEKLEILMQKINDSKLVGIDALSYILHLRKVLFTKEEREENISITILRDNELINSNQIATASAVISINTTGFKNSPSETIYYLYHPKVSFQKTTLEDIQNKFNNGTYSYIEEKDPNVPGVTSGGMKK